MSESINKTVNTKNGKVKFSYRVVRTELRELSFTDKYGVISAFYRKSYIVFKINDNEYKVDFIGNPYINTKRNAAARINSGISWFYKDHKLTYDNFKKAIEFILKFENIN